MKTRDYPPKDYTERLEKNWVRAIFDILSEAASLIHGPGIVVSTSIISDNVCLRNSPSGELTREDIERFALVPKKEATAYAFGLMLYASDSSAYYEKLTVQDAFLFPAGQVNSVAKSLLNVANYDGPLPFYAETMIREDPRWN
ncbi:MAG: hypothetical protein AABX96_05340 [Nanoarchaeota archaeon]